MQVPLGGTCYSPRNPPVAAAEPINVGRSDLGVVGTNSALSRYGKVALHPAPLIGRPSMKKLWLKRQGKVLEMGKRASQGESI